MSSLVPRSTVQRLLQPPVLLLARLGVHPNHLTVLGTAGGIGAGALAAAGQLLPAGVLLLAASALDLLDGALARATGRATRFGSVFDAVMDRLSEGGVLFGIAYYLSGQGEQDGVLLALAAVIASFLVSYVRARAEIVGIPLTEGLFARPERVLLLGVGLIIGQVETALWVLAVAAGLTALQRLILAWRRSGGDRSDTP